MQAGLQMDYFFDENYAFVLGFGINNLGESCSMPIRTLLNVKGMYLDPGQSAKLNLQYLDIPLGLKLKTEELGYATFFLQLGFNPMFNINGQTTSEDGIYDKEDITASITTFFMGYHVGAGVEYKLGGSTAVIGGLRWSSGLTDVTENDRANVKTNVISIHLGILF